MKKLVVAFVLTVMPFMAHAETYTIESTHTYPNFIINHLGFSDTFGRFNKTTGKLEMDREKGMGSVEVVIDVASLDTGFAKRDDHLRSPDFFNVVEFPEATFKSTRVTYKGEGAEVVGNLTIKGITRSVTLNVAKINCGPNPFNKKPTCGMNATGTIKRSDFGITYGLPAVGDEVKLNIQIEAVKG